jgi:ATP-binding cassette subfamily F protein uup
LLLGFDGTVLLVSHDRKFMDNVVTSIMVFEEDSTVREYVGGYSDWVARGGNLADFAAPQTGIAASAAAAPAPEIAAAPKPESPKEPKKKLSYNDKRALEAALKRIDVLEAKQSALEAQISDPAFYDGDAKQVQATLKDVATAAEELAAAYAEWEQLEG